MQPLAILFGALFTVAVATVLGAFLLGDRCVDPAIRFVTGSALLSAAVFGFCCVGLAYPLTFLVFGALVLAAWWRRRPRRIVVPRESLWFLAIFGAYFLLYLVNAMAPEASPDGSAYHLGLVSRYLREHGFHRTTWDIYASLSQGVEMLFLFAFAFGRHSAAATVHLAFLVALAWAMFSYARRAGSPMAGGCGALLVFASPVVGSDGTSAYNDVAVAAIVFTLFWLLQSWDECRSVRVLVAAGLVAGFAYAAKYTAGLAVPYAIGFVAWKWRKPSAGADRDCPKRPAGVPAWVVVGLCAAVMVVPWMAKNWLWVQNPVSPLFNRFFPNPYVTSGFESEYRHNMAHYYLPSRWQIPMEATTYGGLFGVLGPVFLLTPVALLAIGRREGRQLLLAALVFGAAYCTNIGTRFLIPALPFVALAMALVLARIPRAALAVAVLHAVISWPSIVPLYCRADAWHLSRIPFRQALRIRSEDRDLESRLPLYGAARMVDRVVAPGSTVFAFTSPPQAYLARRILVAYQSASNEVNSNILKTGFNPEYAPTWRLRFAFPRQALRQLRVLQTGTATDTLWRVHELRVFDGVRELPRAARWRLRACPNPWSVQDAFDNTLITFWTSAEPLRPGMSIEVDFGALETADSVLIETSPNQPGVRLKLEGLAAGGPWKQLAQAPRIFDAPPPLGLRRAAAQELKRRGIDYLFLLDGEDGAADLRRNPDLWGIREVGEYRGARLYLLP